MRAIIKSCDGIAEKWKGVEVELERHPVHPKLFRFKDEIKNKFWLVSEWGIERFLEE